MNLNMEDWVIPEMESAICIGPYATNFQKPIVSTSTSSYCRKMNNDININSMAHSPASLSVASSGDLLSEFFQPYSLSPPYTPQDNKTPSTTQPLISSQKPKPQPPSQHLHRNNISSTLLQQTLTVGNSNYFSSQSQCAPMTSVASEKSVASNNSAGCPPVSKDMALSRHCVTSNYEAAMPYETVMPSPQVIQGARQATLQHPLPSHSSPSATHTRSPSLQQMYYPTKPSGAPYPLPRYPSSEKLPLPGNVFPFRLDPEKIKEMLTQEEEKRQRNTAASARFRQKKKQREQELVRVATEMTSKVKLLESRVIELEAELTSLRLKLKNENKETSQ